MFHFTKFNEGRYLTIGSIFHKSLEVGYQLLDCSAYDLTLSITAKQSHAGLKFSLCLGRFLFEFNLCDLRQYDHKSSCYIDEDLGYEQDDYDLTPADPIVRALPEITMSSILGIKKSIVKEDDEIEETYDIKDMCYSTPKAINTLDSIQCGSPEHTSAIVDLPIQSQHKLSYAEAEFAEHGSIALRHWQGAEDGSDNIIGGDRKLVEGNTVILRAKEGGFHFPHLHRDNDGWYVMIDEEKEDKVDVVFDGKRGMWVIRGLV